MAQTHDLSGNFPPSLPTGLDPRLANSVDPATRAVAVTPSDSTILNARSLYIGGAGNVAVQTVVDPATTVIFNGVPAGTILPVTVLRVLAATTATNIVALY